MADNCAVIGQTNVCVVLSSIFSFSTCTWCLIFDYESAFDIDLDCSWRLNCIIDCGLLPAPPQRWAFLGMIIRRHLFV